MKQNVGNRKDSLKQVLDYHSATKHYFQNFVIGPDSLDWANQPEPFRRDNGSQVIYLEKIPPTKEPLYDEAFVQEGLCSGALTF
ncbi:MAG: hypothetical protein QM500_08295 [Methylococcales bacterium]